MSGGWEGTELLQPISAEQPCGQSLEDTALLSSFDGYRLFGQSTPLEPPPAWSEIRNSALDALTKSKDLRLLAHLGTALLRTDGLPAFAATLSVASDWISKYWSEVYPQIDEDAILRRNALNCFADPIAVVDRVRRVPLISTRQHGTFSLRDVEIATGVMQPSNGEPRPDESAINAAFQSVPLEELTAVQVTATRALTALRTVDSVLRDKAGTSSAPDFDGLLSQFTRIDKLVRAQLASRPDAAGAFGQEGGAETAAAAGGALGPIKSRQDAVRALDLVADFFRRTEPSSPIPLFIDRAKRLVSKDFLEVLADIAPEALGTAKAAGGLREKQEQE